MKRHLAVLTVIAVFVSACANPLGRTVPECDSAGNSMVLQVQSVPGSAYVACVNGLKTGWEYEHLQARSGRSVFSLDSDRMGASFIVVEDVLSCDVGGATPADSDDPAIALFKDVVSETTLEVVLVPEGSSEETAARADEILSEFDGTEIKGRTVMMSISASDDSTAARISRATAAGAHVIIISIRDAEEGTLTVLLEGRAEELEVEDLDDAIDAIEDAEAQSSYRGKWYFVFEGGCVVYTFDAEGPGVGTIESDIQAALGLYDAAALRQTARDLGYDVR